MVNRRYLWVSLMVASDWINFFPSYLNVTTYKMTCGSRRKFIKRHHKAVARSQLLLVSKLWKSQKNSATFPVMLHSIMLPRGHGTWMHRALGAGFQCLLKKKNYRWFHIIISTGEGRAKSRRNRSKNAISYFQNVPKLWSQVCTFQVVSVKMWT